MSIFKLLHKNKRLGHNFVFIIINMNKNVKDDLNKMMGLDLDGPTVRVEEAGG
jgi:hypothetical protein